MEFTMSEEKICEELKAKYFDSFQSEWRIKIISKEEELVFYFYQLSIQRELSIELLKKIILKLSGKENDMQDFLAGVFLHYKAFFLWRDENEFLAAQNSLLKAVEILSAIQSHSHQLYLGRVYDTLGLLMKSESQLKEAAAMFSLAIDRKSFAQDKEGLAITYGNLGRLNMEMGNFDEAIKYFNLDIDLMASHFPENIFIRAQLLSTLAWAYLESNQLIESEGHYKDSKIINIELQNPTGLFYNEIGLAEIALKRKEISLAHEFLIKANINLNDERFFKPAYESSLVQYVFVEALILKAEEKIEEAFIALDGITEKYSKSINPIQLAKIYLAKSDLCQDTKKVLYLKKSLEVLDKTEHVKLRVDVEKQLKDIARSEFLLHAAGRFAGKDQLEQLIENAGEDGFQGEEKELAVLFSDIRGFTTLSEKLSPQDLITTLNRFFTLMTKVISDYGGYVDKFIGDAIMAVFSFPKEGEGSVNHCEQAVRAALHMRSELNRFKITLGKGFEDLDVGVGIHYGKMVSGLIGSPQKRSFTVIGDAVNTASRLEGLTKQLGGTLVVSEEVIQKLQKPEKFIIRHLGSYRPKGKKNPLKLYDIPAFSGTDYWSQELMQEAEQLKIYDQLNSQNKKEEAEELMTFLLENPINNYQAGYQLLYSELQKYPSLEEYSKWDKVINLFSK